jgi:hypothetical protein
MRRKRAIRRRCHNCQVDMEGNKMNIRTSKYPRDGARCLGVSMGGQPRFVLLSPPPARQGGRSIERVGPCRRRCATATSAVDLRLDLAGLHPARTRAAGRSGQCPSGSRKLRPDGQWTEEIGRDDGYRRMRFPGTLADLCRLDGTRSINSGPANLVPRGLGEGEALEGVLKFETDALRRTA